MKKNFKNSAFMVLLLSLLLTSCNGIGGSSSREVSLIPVRQGSQWGFVDWEGSYVINPQFNEVRPFSEGLALAKSIEGNYGYIDTKGEWAIPATFVEATSFCNGVASVVREGGYPIVINTKGEELFTLQQARRLFGFQEDAAVFVSKEGKFGAIDKEGKIIIEPIFEKLQGFSEGLAAFSNKDDKWGFVDKNGKYIINPQFDEARNFSEGLAAVESGGKLGFIDKKGVYVINPQFDEGSSFMDGYASFLQGGKAGVIDTKGQYVINPQYDFVMPTGGLFLVQANGLYGFVDKKGQYVINPQFTDIVYFDGDKAIVESGDKWGIIDSKGKYTVNPQFEAIFNGIQMDRAAYHYVNTLYYNTAECIDAFFTRANSDKQTFDGINASTTLAAFRSHDVYKESSMRSSYLEYTGKINLNKNEEVAITSVRIDFGDQIYQSASWYSSEEVYWDKTVKGITYEINLSGDAVAQRTTIYKAFKRALEQRYGEMSDSDIDYPDGTASVRNENKISASISASYNIIITISFPVNIAEMEEAAVDSFPVDIVEM